MSSIVILKELWDYCQEETSFKWGYKQEEKYRLILKKFGERLKSQGWVYYPYEGGWVSPDRSTIFYDFRNPYNGQLYPWMDQPTPEYEALIKEMIDSGEFIIV